MPIFARRILKLEPLPPLGARPDAALRGGIVHEALAAFAQRIPSAAGRPARRARDVRQCGARGAIPDIRASPPSGCRGWSALLHWFADTEPSGAASVTRIFAEIDGSLVLPAPGAAVHAHGARRPDRHLTGAKLVITDYKTGTPPTDKR